MPVPVIKPKACHWCLRDTMQLALERRDLVTWHCEACGAEESAMYLDASETEIIGAQRPPRDGGLGLLGRALLLAGACLLAVGCGANPLEPTPAPVSMAVQVYGHISARPIVGEPVVLFWDNGGVATATPLGAEAVRTDATGVARWRVQPGRAYVALVRGVLHFQGVVVVNDSQWLLSLPE